MLTRVWTRCPASLSLEPSRLPPSIQGGGIGNPLLCGLQNELVCEELLACRWGL